MPAPISTENAGAVYERRYDRPWREDAAMGLFVALYILLLEAIARGAIARQRASEKRPRIKIRPLPVWAREALVRFRAKVGPFVGPDAAFPYRLVTHPGSEELADKLAGEQDLDPLEQLMLPRLMPIAERVFAEFDAQRRRDHGAFGFYVGVRVMATWSRSEEPRPAQVALLAAAAGLEPVEPSQDAFRKVWEDRIRRWKPEMDEHGWRGLVAQLEWRPELMLALPQ